MKTNFPFVFKGVFLYLVQDGIVKFKQEDYLWFFDILLFQRDSLVAQTVKRLPAMQETQVWSPGQEDPLEKEMATYSSTLAWKIPWMEEPGGLQSWGHKESDTTQRLRFHFSFISTFLLRLLPPPPSQQGVTVLKFSSVQSLSRVWLFATPWTAARQASLSITISQSLLRLMSIESVMPSNHLIPCRPLLPSVFPSISLFQWISSSHQLAKGFELQLQHQLFQWIFRIDFLSDWMVWSPCSPRDSQDSSAPQLPC